MRKILLRGWLAWLAVSLAANAFGEAKWTFENNVLTEVESATSGSTLWAFNLSSAGVLAAKTYGNGSVLDFRKAAMPEGAPDIVRFSGRGLFQENGTSVKELFMPESLTTIDSCACIRMKGLTNLVWSANVTTIGDYAFRECTALKGELVFPPKMTSVPFAFDGCSSLTGLRLHADITAIAGSAFSGCSGITTPLELGFGTDAEGQALAMSVGGSAFYSCNKIPYIRLGPGFTTFPNGIVSMCTGLRYVEMADTVTACNETFCWSSGHAALTNVVIKYAGEFAFSASVSAFKNVTTLKEISFGGWFTYTPNATYNPFSGWSDLQARFIVDGSNETCKAFCADATKVTPWRQVPYYDQAAYYERYGDDAKIPYGVTVAVANGLPSTYLVRRGDFDNDLPKVVYPFEDDNVYSTETSIWTNTVDGRSVYMVTTTAHTVTLITKRALTLEEALVVGGGGAGAALKGGGGGGGGVIDDTLTRLIAAGTEISISVGAGAIGNNYRKTGPVGSPTTLTIDGTTQTAFGGGGGGSDADNLCWKPSQTGNIGSGGGTGAGGSITHADGTDYTASQGHPGGDSSNGGVGGGGGAYSAGESGSSGKSGHGGEGLTNSITGVAQVYGSGGGGGTGNPNSGTVTTQALGGTNAGDGAPYASGAAGGDAPAGFGGGGGGGGYYNKTSSTRGGNGGSGVVILAFTVGGTAGQPAVAKEDIVIGHYEDTTLPSVSVTMGHTGSSAIYAATVRISCGTGALAQAGTSYDCTREYTSVTNGQVIAFLADFYPRPGEQVYVQVEVTATGADAVSQTNDATASGTLPAFVGHGGGEGIIHVRTGAMGRNDGTDWANAYTDFREAITHLDATHSELWFCGSDTADINTPAIAPTAAATIRGGFTGVEDSVADRPAGSRSRIDNLDYYDCLTIKNPQPIVIEGFFLTKGYYHGISKSGAGDIVVTNCVFDGNGTYANAVDGRAAYLTGTASSTRATVVDCTFLRHYERYTNGAGGALTLASLAGATVSDCLFASNGLALTTNPFTSTNGRDSSWGAAMAASGVPVWVERCQFRGNIGNSMYINGHYAGGVVTLRGNCGGSVFRNCLWVGNNSIFAKEAGTTYLDPEGGALVLRLGAASQVTRVENCTFAWNFYSGSNSTAGVNVRAGTLALTNTLFWGNACGTQKCQRPADLYVQSGATANVGYTRFSDEAEIVADDGGTLSLGTGVTYGDPLLVTVTNALASCRSFGESIAFKASAGAAISDFNAHLRSRVGYFDSESGELVSFRGKMSPAIDAGDPASGFTSEPDIPGVGMNGRRINLGCYGNTLEAALTPLKGVFIRVR